MDRYCEVCGMGEMVLGETSVMYCKNCGAQSNQFIEEAFDADDAHMFTTTFVRERGLIRNAEHQSQPTVTPASARDDVLDAPMPDVQEIIRLTQRGTQNTQFASVKTEDFSQLGSQFGLDYDPMARMSKEELAVAIRKSYLGGLQKILHLQLECLVREFGVTPLICGIAGPVWLRFVASTRVLESTWAEEAVTEDEHRERARRASRPQNIPEDPAAAPKDGDAAAASGEGDAAVAPGGEDDTVARGQLDAITGKKKRKRVKRERKRRGALGPRTVYGRHLSYVWLSALKESIPLVTTLAVSYLACYIAREPILATDIRHWAAEGRLPYLAAFVEISKSAPHHISHNNWDKQVFPMKPRLMFQPARLNGARYLELLAGFVAERAGVQLPPANFHGLCALFIRDMGLPVEKLLPYVCRVYDWYTPAGVFLSTRRGAFPIRVYVMAIMVITMKVLYNLDGRPLQQEEEKGTEMRQSERKTGRRQTERKKRRPPTSNEEGTQQTMLTRAMARAQAKANASSAQGCVGEAEKQTSTAGNGANNTGADNGGDNGADNRGADVGADNGVANGVATGADDSAGIRACGAAAQEAVSGGRILGKRERSTATRSEDCGGRGEGSGDDGGILRTGRGRAKKSRKTDGAFHDEPWELHDVKELLQLLEAVNPPSPVNFDEELEKYLQYCRTVVFTGTECDTGVEPVVELFRGIYEKHLTKVRSQQVADSDDEAAASEGTFRRPTQHAGPSGKSERSGSPEQDAPSAASSRNVWGSRPAEGSKQKSKRKPKGKEKVTSLHDKDSAPAAESDGGPLEAQDASNHTFAMLEAGFCPLPVVDHPMGWDEYLRYTFQVASSDQGLIPVHESYFRVLQACAKAAKVHPSALHRCVQRIEKGLLRMESSVEKFLVGEKGSELAELVKAVERRNPKRRRDKVAQAENARAAKERTRHLRDLSYL